MEYEDALGRLEEENDELKEQLSEQESQIDFLKDENQHMMEVLKENRQLKGRLMEYEEQITYEERLRENPMPTKMLYYCEKD